MNYDDDPKGEFQERNKQQLKSLAITAARLQENEK